VERAKADARVHRGERGLRARVFGCLVSRATERAVSHSTERVPTWQNLQHDGLRLGVGVLISR